MDSQRTKRDVPETKIINGKQIYTVRYDFLAIYFYIYCIFVSIVLIYVCINFKKNLSSFYELLKLKENLILLIMF